MLIQSRFIFNGSSMCEINDPKSVKIVEIHLCQTLVDSECKGTRTIESTHVKLDVSNELYTYPQS